LWSKLKISVCKIQYFAVFTSRAQQPAAGREDVGHRSEQWVAGDGHRGEQWVAGDGHRGEQWVAGDGHRGEQWVAGDGHRGEQWVAGDGHRSEQWVAGDGHRGEQWVAGDETVTLPTPFEFNRHGLMHVFINVLLEFKMFMVFYVFLICKLMF